MLYFSYLLKTDCTYKTAADNLFAALDLFNIKYKFISNTKDIWVRDFMPVKLRSGRFISFQYEPSYLRNYPELRTDYRKDISHKQKLTAITYSNINLDGGNVVFSPSKQKAVISDRVFYENPEYSAKELVEELEKLLEAEVIIIPSLSMRYDMTGHADGMVRFLDENTVLGNRVTGKYTFEKRIASVLQGHGINTILFPYFDGKGISAEGCYLNYLETDSHIFLPTFENEMDCEANDLAEKIFPKTVVPVCISSIARYGGGLNCISWEA
ncbi:MAG: agmatine deiminase family protein [Oscillospiraceae bacterium]|nr:agmatine deiminase family protein [Oscillospiraceae bacterium]